jgi:hypothetical protein
MNRAFAFIGALLLAFVSVSSACTAAPAERLRFTLDPQHGGDRIEASFRSETRGRQENNWQAGFRPTELVGLDLAGFRGAGNRPLRFALIREAGRLDCSGQGGESHAAGYCGFTPDASFLGLLESRGIGRPRPDQAFGLMAVDARREVVDAVAAAHYPTPSLDDLMALAALDVNGAYIREMARAGYRPRDIDTLVQFKALDITPEWIGGFVRIGYAGLPTDDLVQLKALQITPEFIAGFDRVGYRHLPIEKLVELKALDITPEFVRSVGAQGSRMPVEKLVELKIFGSRR